MVLSHDEGMSALRAMFPDWDAQVLAELLEANEGHLENTIDMVLTMEPPPSSSASAAAHAAPSFAIADARDDNDDHYSRAVASPAPNYRKTPPPSPQRKASSSARGSQRISRVTLPDDFLRLPVDPSYGHHELSEQEQRDAVLAEMLQNEIFRQELLASEEFATHFHSDATRAMHERPSLQARTSATAYPEKSASEIASETFNAMSVKFASMSEVMKKKASEMYMRFQTRADAPAEKDPYSHRPLMADDSSDEEDNRSAGGSARDMRQRHKDKDARMSPRSSSSTAAGPVRRPTATKKND